MQFSLKSAQNSVHKPNMSQIGGQLRTSTGGIQGLGKVDKIYLDNPTLIYTLAGKSVEIGTVRETFFFNQTRSFMPVTVSPISDFLIDGKYTFEVGGKKKKQNQLQNIEICSKGRYRDWLWKHYSVMDVWHALLKYHDLAK